MNVNPFECDKDAKKKVGAIMRRLLESKGRVVQTAETLSNTDVVDVTLTSITTSNSNRQKLCAIEVKERTYPQPFEEEFINVEKLSSKQMNDYRDQGYTILWAALYPNRLIVWQVDKVEKHYSGTYMINKHTVLDDGRIPQQRWSVNIKDAIIDVTL